MKLGSKLIIAFLIVSALIGSIGLVSSEISKNMLYDSIGNNSIDVAVQMLDNTDLSLQNNIDLFSMLSKEQMIQSNLIKSNEEFSKLDDIQKTIDVLDDEWISLPTDQQSSFMIKLINNDLSNSFRSHQKFLNEKHGYSYLGEVFVTNAYGANVAQTGRTSDYKQSDEVWWQTAKEQGFDVGPIEFDNSASIFARDVSVSALDDNGKFLGVIKHVINVQEIFQIIDSVDNLKKFDSQHFTLLNEYNQIIYSTTPSYDDSMFLDEFSQKQILDKINKQSDYFILSSPSEDDKLVSYTTSKDESYSKWTLIIDYDVSEILLPLKNLQLILLSISGIVTLFSILFGVYISRSISNPISHLQNEMYKVEQGIFSLNPQKITNDEIGDLNKSFEKMSKSIEKTLELEKKLVRADEKIKSERFSAIGELSARLAHDIRNPLSIIKTSNDILSVAREDPILFEKTINRNNKAIDRISHQIDGVMNFLKNSELHLESVSLSELITLIIDEIPIPDEIKINLPTNDVVIEADSIKLSSLFSNLIMNAVQAMENKGTITLRLLESNGKAEIEIEDDGPAIPEKNLETIFEPLYTTKQTGTGLGLASCKSIVKQHNGTISVSNDPVTFKIILPLKINELDK